MTAPQTKVVTRAVVTGHTRGLGDALAAALLERGIAVLGVARSLNASLAQRYPHALTETELDLADPAQLAQWLGGDALRGFLAGAARVVLINNAGMVQPIGPLETQDVSAIAGAVSLNVATPLMMASAFTTASADATDRRIVHVSSGAARNAYAGWSIYCATKAALDHHARAVALDETRALRICSLAPGVVDTGMQAEIRDATTEQFPSRGKFEDLKRNGQLASPEASAAKLVDYVLSDAFGQEPVADIRSL
ncbi:SDR family oxidoreductase [Paraburkholderia sartisoli]|uniref:Short-chain dehydrogenase n=1 Tax=Paraburkholderia sartisoli TaxID=83784 RepID=A0A1H4ENG4_9BURK|nr:SDR family oxidoreductase [Paraburkholderia sartisoli]SEA86208.1 hypothetical protein SAMN05192564_103478 [Paraburkholderia sartisoli]